MVTGICSLLMLLLRRTLHLLYFIRLFPSFILISNLLKYPKKVTKSFLLSKLTITKKALIYLPPCEFVRKQLVPLHLHCPCEKVRRCNRMIVSEHAVICKADCFVVVPPSRNDGQANSFFSSLLRGTKQSAASIFSMLLFKQQIASSSCLLLAMTFRLILLRDF